MSGIDIVLIILVLFGAIGGYRQGFLMSVVSLLGVVVGILLAFKLMGVAMLVLEDRFQIGDTMLPFVAFLVVFVIVLLLVSLLGRLLKASIDKTLLGSLDQVLGAVVGIAKFIFLMSIVIWLLDYAGIEKIDAWRDDSVVLRLITRIAPTLAGWAGKVFPAVADIFENVKG